MARLLPTFFRTISQVHPITGRGHSLHGQSVQRVAEGWLLVECVDGDWHVDKWSGGWGREVHKSRAEYLGMSSLSM